MASQDVLEFRGALSRCREILVVSGAGISAASGWSLSAMLAQDVLTSCKESQRLEAPVVDGGGITLPKWQLDPLLKRINLVCGNSFILGERMDLTPRVRNAIPNDAHYTLARLSIPEIRSRIAPRTQFTHVTQNVDGLCKRALTEVASNLTTEVDSSSLIEMHGRLFDVVCTAHDCDFLETDMTSPICPALAGTERLVAEGDLEPVVKRKDLPHCPRCDQLLRPDVVFFGERPKQVQDVLALANRADMCLIVGTSALVQPASKIGGLVKEHGGKIAVFNLHQENHWEEANFIFLGPCEERLSEVLGI